MATARASCWLGPSAAGLLVYRFTDLQSPSKPVRILGAYSEAALEEWVTHYPDVRFERTVVGLGDTSFYVALNGGFEIFPGGKPSNSQEQGSEAIYWFECDLGDHGYKGYTLLPGKESSIHDHWVHDECIYRVTGQTPTLWLGMPAFKDGERKLRLDTFYVARAGVEHQLVARSRPVFIVVEILGSDPLGMEDHHYACVG